MIIEFKLANYRSINEEQTLSFVAENARRHPNNLIARPGYKLLKTAALFGANASGKSNLVKAIGAMQEFVRDSATRMNDGDAIKMAQPYLLDPAAREGASLFGVKFTVDGQVYTYGFAVTRSRVIAEVLTVNRELSHRETILFKRSIVADSGRMAIDVDTSVGEVKQLLLERTRDNALLLSTAARENVRTLQIPFRYLCDSINFYDASDSENSLILAATDRCNDDKQLLSQVTQLLRDADTGIEDIMIDRMEMPSFDSVNLEKSGVSSATLQFLREIVTSKSIPFVTTLRRGSDGEKVKFGLMGAESRGTSRFLHWLFHF